MLRARQIADRLARCFQEVGRALGMSIYISFSRLMVGLRRPRPFLPTRAPRPVFHQRSVHNRRQDLGRRWLKSKNRDALTILFSLYSSRPRAMDSGNFAP